MRPEFSILVVCLNPGDKLNMTLQSVKEQMFTDYEIIIKDGGSTDGSIEKLEEQLSWADKNTEAQNFATKIKIVRRKDAGIYDAMNQAVLESSGAYCYFLNCGDIFADADVLGDIAKFIKENPALKGIYYGNIYERLTGEVVASNPRLDDFGCYRNVPCHQACFYEKELLLAHPFETKCHVRADYEQFLWCYFKGGAKTLFTGRLIADYEGGGFSETKENKKRSAKEHQEIVKLYMSSGQILKYKMILWITLSPLRTRLSQSEKTAGFYNRLKGLLYKIRK